MILFFAQAPENMKDEAVFVGSGKSLLLDFAQHLRLTSTSSDVESIKIAVQVQLRIHLEACFNQLNMSVHAMEKILLFTNRLMAIMN